MIISYGWMGMGNLNSVWWIGMWCAFNGNLVWGDLILEVVRSPLVFKRGRMVFVIEI